MIFANASKFIKQNGALIQQNKSNAKGSAHYFQKKFIKNASYFLLNIKRNVATSDNFLFLFVKDLLKLVQRHERHAIAVSKYVQINLLQKAWQAHGRILNHLLIKFHNRKFNVNHFLEISFHEKKATLAAILNKYYFVHLL